MTRGWWAAITTMRPAAACALSAASTRSSVSGSRPAVGSSSSRSWPARQQRPGEGDPAALAGREAAAALGHYPVQWHVVQGGRAGRRRDRLVRGIRAAEPDVGRHRAGEQVRLLGNPAHVRPPGLGVHAAQVVAVDENPAGGRPGEAEQHVDQRGLPRPAGAGQHGDLPARKSAEKLSGAGPGRPGCDHADPLGPDGARGGSRGRSPAGRRPASRSPRWPRPRRPARRR